MKGKVKLISSLVLMGMLFTLTGTAWAAEPAGEEGLRGQVMAVEGNTVLVVAKGGEEHRVVTDEDTRFRIPGVGEPAIEDIDIGDFIGVRGERDEGGRLMAEVIIVLPAEYALHRNIVRGQVLAVEDSTLTVETRLGEKLVIVDEETRFRIPGIEEPTVEDISVGDHILALGRPYEEGNLLARMVVVVTGEQLQRHTVRGLVTDIDPEEGTLGVTTRRGEMEVVTGEGTIFRIPGVEDPGIADLSLRDLVLVLGTWDAEQEVFVARVVGLIPRWPSHLRLIRGGVTGTENRTIVLHTLRGEVRVLTDGETIYRIPDVEDPGLDDLETGDRVLILAARTEAGPFLAKVVVVRRNESSFVSEVMGPVEAATAMIQELPW